MEGKCLSLRLYEILETVGASEKMRKLYRHTATTQEILECRYPGMGTLVAGSTYEGSRTLDLFSDTDIIHTCFRIPVTLDAHDSYTIHSLLMVSDEWTYPGYVKLQMVAFGEPQTYIMVCECFPFIGNVCDAEGRACLSLLPRSGPAFRITSKNGTNDIDMVFALRCKSLPGFVINRLELSRKRKLISDEEFEKLKGMGCLFVQVGYYLSSEKNLEWRLSLSLQERYLMTKLNPTQHKVYILLKMIKKNIIASICSSELFTSYQCKTCLLYAVEMTNARSWTPENLINCLAQCIKLLIMWLRNNYCPNFFIPEQNLFSKNGFSSHRKRLLCTLECLLQSNYHFLTLIQSDHVGVMLLDGIVQWRNEADVNIEAHVIKLKVDTIKYNCETFCTISKFCLEHHGPLNLTTALRFLQQAETFAGYTAAETQRAMKHVKPWFHLQIAKMHASLSYRCHDRSYSKRIMRIADVHFRKAERTLPVNAMLAKAAILYKSQQYESCFCVLQQVEHAVIDSVVICACTLCSSAYDWQSIVMSDVSLRKIMKQVPVCCVCVIFHPSEFQLIPTPLQYEMLRSVGAPLGYRFEENHFWYDSSVVDAKVYLFFMQYLVCKELQKQAHKRVAIGVIRALIEEDNVRTIIERRLGHRDTAYNLLGWTYMQEQRYGDAVQCFLKSWEIRPFHNAAKFHMHDLLAKLSDMQQ